jgi:hypothetical protein
MHSERNRTCFEEVVCITSRRTNFAGVNDTVGIVPYVLSKLMEGGSTMGVVPEELD